MRMFAPAALVAITFTTAPLMAQNPSGSPPGGPGRPGGTQASPPRPGLGRPPSPNVNRPPQARPPARPPNAGVGRPPSGTGWRRPTSTRPPPPPPPSWSRNWNQWHRWNYNRPPPGQSWYYADQFYRDGRYYRPRRLGRGDRIYRGSNGRYYCRRSDGTTGLIVGSLTGSLIGGLLANGGSDTLGALIGLGAGAALGRAIDKGQVVCR
ncbi:hypothetical protein LQ953_10410 [Sphingomonas sp. IC-56]|nr:hypothetical protein [Sphingomonas sp. IC-56]MCD2324425.1 hypothetical protein [Sphingomonas sp. IC-56]